MPKNNNLEVSQIEIEQNAIDLRYFRFDELVEEIKKKISQISLDDYSFNDQAIGEKDSILFHFENQYDSMKKANDKLVFGALQYKDDKCYIGKMGLLDENYKSLIIDWRAKVGADFYQATAKDARGIVYRRHIQLKDRKISSIEDELFSTENAKGLESTLIGEAAIMAAMNENRTDKMNDIVATIQKEQDEIIRLPLSQCVLVQGGAGSGKTAVALHRIAYLLYEYRDAMMNKNVLLVGPNNRFLNYIDSVLPSLGETGVVSQTISEVCEFAKPNCESKSDFVRKIKGSRRMLKVIDNAAKSIISIPKKPLIVSVALNEIKITPQEIKNTVRKAIKKTKRHGKFKWTIAKEIFIDLLVELALIKFSEIESDFQNPEVQNEYERDLREDPTFNSAISRIWLTFEPTSFIQRLWSNEKRLQFAAQSILNEEEIQQLLKPQKHGEIEKDDIALIDFAEFLSGFHELKMRKERQKILAKRDEVVNFASEALGEGGVAQSASHLVSAEFLADFVSGDEFKLQNIANYRHIVVDEAQELSQMEFEMLKRRSTNGSFTIVGDIAQTSNPAGAKNWKEHLQHIFNRVEFQELTINYRNPKEIANLAIKVAKLNGLEVSLSKAVRDLENSVKIEIIDSDKMMKRAKDIMDGFSEKEKSQIISSENINEFKGLEFDNVVLIEPANFSHAQDLYVALTRATKSLTILSTNELANWL